MQSGELSPVDKAFCAWDRLPAYFLSCRDTTGLCVRADRAERECRTPVAVWVVGLYGSTVVWAVGVG